MKTKLEDIQGEIGDFRIKKNLVSLSLLFLTLIISITPFIFADIISINSGGSKELCINYGLDSCFFGNVTIGNLLQLTPMTLPTCSATYNGNIGRNATGVYGCNATCWGSKAGGCGVPLF